MANISKELQESLKRHNELLSYDIKKGKSSLNEKRYHSYASDVLNEQDPEEEGTDEEAPAEGEGGDNPDFDFGGTEEGGTEGEETPEGEEAPAEGEEEGDEFGTADEFSAADEIETETEEDSDVEEVDVTDIVKRADDAKEYAEKAVTAATEGKDMIQDLMSQFKSLQDTLKQLDTLSGEITSIKKDIQAQKPKEKLELRSLDSYPFNVKLTDYWNDEKVKGNYEVTGSEEKYEIKPDDVKNYDTLDIKKSFVPESKSKKKVLTENDQFKKDYEHCLTKPCVYSKGSPQYEFFEEHPDSWDRYIEEFKNIDLRLFYDVINNTYTVSPANKGLGR